MDEASRDIEHVEASKSWSCLLPISGKSTPSIQATVLAFRNMDLTNINVLHLARQVEIAKSSLPLRSFCLASPNAIIPSPTDGKFEPPQNRRRKIVFLFTGQGAQWSQMGKALIQQYSSFRGKICELNKYLCALKNAPSWNLEGEASNLTA